jgi:FtsH-binding integral membrane protein
MNNNILIDTIFYIIIISILSIIYFFIAPNLFQFLYWLIGCTVFYIILIYDDKKSKINNIEKKNIIIAFILYITSLILFILINPLIYF